MSIHDNSVQNLKVKARKIQAETGCVYSQALDKVANEFGFQNWSLLAKYLNAGSALASTRARPASVSAGGEVPSKYLDHLPVHVDLDLGFSNEEEYWCEQATEAMLRSAPIHSFGISFHEDLLTAELRVKPDSSEYLFIRAATSNEVHRLVDDDHWSVDDDDWDECPSQGST